MEMEKGKSGGNNGARTGLFTGLTGILWALSEVPARVRVSYFPFVYDKVTNNRPF